MPAPDPASSRAPAAAPGAPLLRRTLLLAGMAAVLAGCSTAPTHSTRAASVAEVAADPALRRDALAAAGSAPLSGTEARRYVQRLSLRLRSALVQTPVSVALGADDVLRVTLPASFAFTVDGAQLLPGVLPELDVLALALGEFDRTLIDLVGHSDSIGPREGNVAFTRRRADALADYLLSRGVAARRVVTRGAGESTPIASNDTLEGRQRNRRIELVITPLTR
jgi:outer membrane protein OmpA-like peptidoglycan-associated protein